MSVTTSNKRPALRLTLALLLGALGVGLMLKALFFPADAGEHQPARTVEVAPQR